MRGWLQYMLSSTFACPTSEDGLVLVAVRAFNQYVAFMENEAEDEDGLCEECDRFCVLRMLRQCFVTTAHRAAVTHDCLPFHSVKDSHCTIAVCKHDTRRKAICDREDTAVAVR